MTKKKTSKKLQKEIPKAELKSPYIKLPDVVAYSSCSVRHIKEEISRGNLRAYKPGKELLFKIEDVDKWITKKVA